MNRLLTVAGLFLAAALVAPAHATESPAEDHALVHFDVANIDRSVDPCTDFYQFACGTWRAKNPIPPDQSRWGRFNLLAEQNRTTLREILDAAAKPGPGRDAVDTQIGDYYASCMDEAAIEAAGPKALAPLLDRIASLKSKQDLAGEVGRLHTEGISVLFGFGSEQDFKDATAVIPLLDQGGLGLPDRDFYFREDPKSQELRTKYVAHVTQMLTLLGETPAAAAADAKTIMELETALAKVSLDRVSRRDPAQIYHKLTKDELGKLAPSFSWGAYLAALQAPPFSSVNVTVPDFLKGLESLIASTSLDAWKTYLRWHTLHSSAVLLPAAFVNEDFAFYGKALTGQREQRPRWKRCVGLTDAALGDALGKKYVERTFGADGKARMERMVVALFKALEADIKQLAWMTDATKKEALVKLHAVAHKIGYPDKWRDYSALKVVRGDALGNAKRADAFELARQLAKIGKPVDRGEWLLSPPTVNAYYNPLMNDINFPAGILQPPFFERGVDDAVNFGGVGAMIGHELTHGFDDQGRQFDSTGNLRDWWSEADGKEFEKRAGCIDEQYAGFTAVADVKLNGKLTLGENVADSGGLRIAYMALMDELAAKPQAPLDGFTAPQRFFLNYAQIACSNSTDEVARMQAQMDPHSPPRWRVNGVLMNMSEFQQAFGCKAGTPMVRENACRVW
jgi:putative endopeptidase